MKAREADSSLASIALAKNDAGVYRLARVGAAREVVMLMGRKFATGVVAALLGVVGVSASANAEGPYRWQGTYFGAHFGWAGSDIERSILAPSFFAPVATVGQNEGSPIVGLQLGQNWTSGPWVFGTEVTFSGGPMGEMTSPFFAVDRWTGNVNFLTTVTGRLGYAAGSTLFYVKGGYAGAQVDATLTDHAACGAGFGGGCLHGGGKDWMNGWVAGGGVEYAILRNVTLGLEYNFIDLGSTHQVNGTVAPALAALDQKVDVEIQTVTARVSFKLN